MDREEPWEIKLECPIPSEISPYADEVQEWLPGWLRGAGLPLDDTGARQLHRHGFARYAGRLYPDTSAEELRTLTALFTWFFLLDDACDGTAGPDPVFVRGLRDGILRLLRVGPRSRHRGFTGPLRRMLVDAWRVPGRRLSPVARDRFVDAVAHHLDGTLVEAGNKAAGRHPSVPEYVELRRATSAAYVSYTLIEFATGRALPDAVYHHPAVREFATTGNDLLSWFNDLLSLNRDTATSGGHNLVLAVARADGLPVRTAVEVVVRRWQQTMDRFVALRAAMPSFGPVLDEPLHDHLDGVTRSVRGTIDWSLESVRYRHSGGPNISVPALVAPADGVRGAG
ncbi:terpene synthase [Micromonospora sp. NPDC049523]|uniref:terpene synthase family protein n=1 Tax=Micromonospora sp. NPDC049523 TaxID=3155921 RepID=UPI0034376CAB